MYRQNFPDHPGLHNRQSSPFHQRRQGLLYKLRQNMVGLIIGTLILGLTTWLLVWNEGRAVSRAKALHEGLSLVVPVGNAQVKAENEGKLIHTTGKVEVNDFYEDKVHGVRIRAARVRRVVEMYQWFEMEDRRDFHEFDGPIRGHPEFDEDIVYRYIEEWSSTLIRSDQFDQEATHKNPDSFPIKSEDHTSNHVQLGHFHISRDLLEKMNEFTMYRPSHVPVGSNLRIYDGMFYHSPGGPSKPEIGDIRVYFQYAGLSGQTLISVVGQQSQGSIIGYPMESGDTLHVLHHGGHSPEAIFERELEASVILTWLMRMTGWVGCFVGCSFLMNILSTLVEYLPIIREITSLGVSLMRFSLATSLSLLVIALSWIWFRPLLGLSLLGAALVPFIVARRRNRRNRNL